MNGPLLGDAEVKCRNSKTMNHCKLRSLLVSKTSESRIRLYNSSFSIMEEINTWASTNELSRRVKFGLADEFWSFFSWRHNVFFLEGSLLPVSSFIGSSAATVVSLRRFHSDFKAFWCFCCTATTPKPRLSFWDVFVFVQKESRPSRVLLEPEPNVTLTNSNSHCTTERLSMRH